MPRKPGPKRLSPDVLKLRGSRHKNRQSRARAGPTAVPRCPGWLDEHGRAEWRRIVRDLGDKGMLIGSDHSALAGMCQSWSVFVRMSARADAMMGDEAASVMDIRRVAAIASDALKNYLRAAGCFGATPMDRAKLDIPADSKPDAMDAYLSRGRRNA